MKLELRYFNDFIQDISGERDIILYGNRKAADVIKKIMVLYQKPAKYVVDDSDYLKLIYEELDSIFVLIVEENYLPVCSKLEKLGFRQQENYRVIFKAKHVNLFEKFPLDINIGYASYVHGMDKELPGITVFGDLNNKEAYKIVTVGGSTSDSQAYMWKCWSQILYERLQEDVKILKKGLVIYSAGISGYRSSQELMKLERDLIGLEPDMVISFSGINDTGNTDYPFVQSYSEQIFEIYASGNVLDMNGGKTVQSYTCGVKRKGSLVQNWLKHMRMMHAICQEFDISFFGFLQPMLGGKKNKLTMHERELVLNAEGDLLERTERFLNEAKQLLKTQDFSYIYDISDLYDEEDVYIDGVHVNERGNELIANRIYEVIYTIIALASIR